MALIMVITTMFFLRVYNSILSELHRQYIGYRTIGNSMVKQWVFQSYERHIYHDLEVWTDTDLIMKQFLVNSNLLFLSSAKKHT